MASKSPAELKSEGAELKIVLAKVKKKPHNCAMLMTKDGIILEVHLKKSPEVLLKAAKKAGGMPKGAWGTIMMEGQVLILDPINDKIPGNLTKVAKKFFSDRGLKNRLEIKEPEGGTASAESTFAEEAPARAAAPVVGDADDESPTRSSQPAPQEAPSGGGANADPRAALVEKLKGLKPRIDTLRADTKSPMVDGLKDILGVFTRAMNDTLFDRAEDALNRLTSVLNDYDALMAEKRPFLDRMNAMAKDIERIAGGSNDEAATAITRYRREFEYAIENSEFYSSGEKLDQIEALIAANQKAGADEAADIPEDAPANPEAPAAETDGPDGERGRLVGAFKALTPSIRTALQADDKSAVKNIGTLAKGFASAIKAQDLAKSRKILDILAPLVAKLTGSPAQQGAPESEAGAGQPSDVSPAQGAAGTQARGDRRERLKRLRATLGSLVQEMRA